MGEALWLLPLPFNSVEKSTLTAGPHFGISLQRSVIMMRRGAQAERDAATLVNA
jgi:hypothetical protein